MSRYIDDCLWVKSIAILNVKVVDFGCILPVISRDEGVNRSI